MGREKLLLFTDKVEMLQFESPSDVPELPNVTAEVPASIVGRMLLQGADIQLGTFDLWGAEEYYLKLGPAQMSRLLTLFDRHVSDQSEINDSHHLVGQLEHDGRWQSPSLRMDPQPLGKMQDGQPYTLLDRWGRPLMSGYPLYGSNAFMTYANPTDGLIIIQEEDIFQASIITHQAPTRLHNHPRYS